MEYDYCDYGLTPAQYHAGVDMLWAALGKTDAGVQDVDVFTQAAEAIKELERLRGGINAAYHLLQNSSGPDGGLVSWFASRRDWVEEFGP